MREAGTDRRSFELPAPEPFLALRAWAMGTGCAIVTLGPALRLGPLLSLDLVVPHRLPVPTGVWGLGPDLPRRVPIGLLVAWLSHGVGAPAVIVALLGCAIAAAFAGASRLAASWGCPSGLQLASGAIYALSPFLLTRVGVGQWGLVAAVGVLPWALPALLEAREPRRVLVWSTALGATGFAGGVLVVLVLAVGLVGGRLRGAVRIAGAAVVGQLPWLVPGVVVASSAGRVAASTAFRTDVHNPADLVTLLAGRGFWRGSSQVGLGGPWASMFGVVLLGLAIVGVSRLSVPMRSRVVALGVVGIVLALASATPGVRGLYGHLAATSLGAPLRDGQRSLVLALVVVAPLAALGADTLATRLRPKRVSSAAAMALGAMALALALPALWGIDGRLEPRAFPAAYEAMARAVHRQRGPVLALPWHEYLDLSYAEGRRVLNPLPDYLGGDVIASSDPEVAGSAQESGDRRALRIDRFDQSLRAGSQAGPLLRELHVRWVALLEEVDWRAYSALDHDPDLQRVDVGPGVRLYRVLAWTGPGVAVDGSPVALQSRLAPVAFVDAGGAFTWARAGQPGWMRGTKAVHVDANGNLRVPGGNRLIWFLPASIVLLGDMVTLVALLWAVRSLFSHDLSVTVA